MQFIKQNIERILLILVCWILGISFLVTLSRSIDVQSLSTFNDPKVLLMILSVVLLLVPFFQKIQIPHLLDLEQQVKESKEQITDFRSEMRGAINQVSLSVAQVSIRNSLSTQVVVSTGIATPIVPPTELSPEAKRILATLWQYQNRQFGVDKTRRWTFTVNPFAPQYPRYLEGLSELVNRGLAQVSPENFQCMLTDGGFGYVDEHSDLKTTHDMYTFP